MTRFILTTALVLLSVCQLHGPSQGCSNIQIDWVDFIQIGSTQYIAGPAGPTTLQESDLGPVIAHVKFKVAGTICDPNYKPKDGDAAFLEVGTPVYAINDHPQSEMVAVRHNRQIVAYKAKAP